jgi:hypothetical protein
MGLDITAWQKVRRLTTKSDGTFEEWLGDEEETTQFYVVEKFAAAADGFMSGAYAVTGDAIEFQAGSYGAYNIWRDQLAQLVGHKDAAAVWASPKPGPFIELINNADNEGTIGPKTSAKLARDFAEWADRVPAFARTIDDGPSRDWFVSRYKLWWDAFTLAAGEGAVELH